MHALIDWLTPRAHRLLCLIGIHDWSFTYAHSWDDDYLWRICRECEKEQCYGLQGGVSRPAQCTKENGNG